MRTILILAVFAILLAMLGYLIVPRVPRPDASTTAAAPAWNPNAVRSTLTGIQVREIDPNHASIVFSYDLDNETGADYQLAKGPSTVIMTRLKADGALVSNDAVQLDNSVFLPAHNRTRISFQVARPFRWPTELVAGRMGPITQDKYRSLLAEEVGNASGFVLFDQNRHYQIELPGGWQGLQSAAPGTTPATEGPAGN
ncbi:MAG: hypothetical protein WA823_11495 [Candidatus Acidiferrales bacterium]